MMIREGRTYRTRGGLIVGPMRQSPTPQVREWQGADCGSAWRPQFDSNGNYIGPHEPSPMDLVIEVNAQ